MTAHDAQGARMSPDQMWRGPIATVSTTRTTDRYGRTTRLRVEWRGDAKFALISRDLLMELIAQANPGVPIDEIDA